MVSGKPEPVRSRSGGSLPAAQLHAVTGVWVAPSSNGSAAKVEPSSLRGRARSPNTCVAEHVPAEGCRGSGLALEDELVHGEHRVS